MKVSLLLCIALFFEYAAAGELEAVAVENSFGMLGLRTRSYVLENFQASVTITNDETGLIKWSFVHNASVSTMKRLVVTAVDRNATRVVSLVRTQFNGNDLLEVRYKPDRHVLAPYYAFGTVRKTATLLLYTGDLEDGSLTDLYIQCSIISSKSDDDLSATYLILLEDILEDGDLALAATAIVLCFVFLVLVITWLVLLMDRRTPGEGYYESFARSRALLWKGRTAVLLAMGKSYRLFFMAAIYFVPAALYTITMVLQYRLGNQDICSFNNLCLNPWGWFPVLNNIVSNIPLVLMGLLVLVVVCSSIYENQACPLCRKQKRVEQCEHYSLLVLAGPAIICEGVMSSVYHLCPRLETYEFDIAYIMLLCVCGILFFHTKLRPERLPILAGYSTAFVGNAIYAVYCMFGLFFEKTVWVSIHLFLLLVAAFCALSGPLYRLMTKAEPVAADRWDLIEFGGAFGLASLLYIMVLTGNLVANEWVLMSMALIVAYLLGLYLQTKWTRGERLSFKCKVFFGLTAFAMLLSGFLFLGVKPTRIELYPWVSREYNLECVLFGIFDTHDIWHFTSALTFYFLELALLFIDDDLNVEIDAQDQKIIVT